MLNVVPTTTIEARIAKAAVLCLENTGICGEDAVVVVVGGHAVTAKRNNDVRCAGWRWESRCWVYKTSLSLDLNLFPHSLPST